MAGSAALVVSTLIDPASGSLTSGQLAPSALAQGACARPSLGTEDAILTAAENSMIMSESVDIFGYVRLRRVEGDWARVVVVPNAQVDHATLILRRGRTGDWQVVAGPGTAGFGPEEIPGSPRALYDPCP